MTKTKKRKQKGDDLEEMITRQILSLEEDLAKQRKAILRTTINPNEKYWCRFTQTYRYRRKRRILDVDDSRVTKEQRRELAQVTKEYTSMIANLKRSLRDLPQPSTKRDEQKSPENKDKPAIDIERFLATGVIDSTETN